MKKNERLQALNILTNVLQNQTPLSYVLSTQQEMSPFCKELCFGVTRQYIRLEAIANCFIKKKPKPKDLDVWLIILMGLYQLHYLKLPDYAVVQESVTLLNPTKKAWAKGLVNAVLRNYCRENTRWMTLQNNELFIYGHPGWLINKIKTNWPQDWQKILQANDQHPPLTLRIHANKTSRENYLKRLNHEGLNALPHPNTNEGIVLETAVNVQALPGFYEGDVSVQDAAAQLAAQLLHLKPGMRVLDACAAPGGKTCHLLEKEPQLKEVVALDIEEKRLARVQENLSRLQLTAKLIKGDGLKPETWWDGLPFDRILLDAPCSATGVIRRNPDIKLLRTDEDIKEITKIQAALLRSLWPLLAPGGILVYATCSIMPEENEQQIARFIQDESNATIVPIETTWGRPTGHGRQILPGENNMDGFFYSVLKK